MSSARSRQGSPRDIAQVAWDRRRRAAWLDYLRIVQSTERPVYLDAEQNAWEQLQRRLRRNDELRDAAATSATSATAPG